MRQLVQVVIVGRIEHAAQRLLGQTDIDQQVQGIQLRGAELRLHHEGRAVQPLRRAEFLALEAMRDHDVIRDGQCIHRVPHG